MITLLTNLSIQFITERRLVSDCHAALFAPYPVQNEVNLI